MRVFPGLPDMSGAECARTRWMVNDLGGSRSVGALRRVAIVEQSVPGLSRYVAETDEKFAKFLG